MTSAKLAFISVLFVSTIIFIFYANVFVINPWFISQDILRTHVEKMASTVHRTEEPFSQVKMFPSHVQFIDQPVISRHSDDPIRILIWTPQQVSLYNFPLNDSVYATCNLPGGKLCQNVADKKLYNTSEAVLFHMKGLYPKDMPKYRLPHHKWIFYEFETPPNTWTHRKSADMNLVRSVFNITMTTYPESDIYINRQLSKCTVNDEKLRNLTRNPINFAKGKIGRVAWFASHCTTQSKRELYAKELAKHIPVDIYGTCGKLRCGSKMNLSNCDLAVLDRKYKFYLSFENSLCHKLNYVTEKLWRIIDNPLSAIPIVLGGVDYTQMLPDNTYLDVKDFASPKHLAEHLKKLDADDKAFNEIITKKKSLVCEHATRHPSSQHCAACQYLHNHRNEITQIPNVLDYWSTSKLCISAKDFFNGSLNIV